jgi:hypothetical protein
VIGHLVDEVRPASFLSHRTQIAIEFPVPQIGYGIGSFITGIKFKRQVCKDVVIWPEAGMTCWDATGKPTVPPAAIIEWKFGVHEVYRSDVEWLVQFSSIHRGFIGYAVAANRPGAADFLLACERVADGAVDSNWLLLK